MFNFLVSEDRIDESHQKDHFWMDLLFLVWILLADRKYALKLRANIRTGTLRQDSDQVPEDFEERNFSYVLRRKNCSPRAFLSLT